MRLTSKLSKTVKRIGLGLAVGAMICLPVSNLLQTASSAACQGDDNANAVIRCGAFTTDDVQANYNNNPSVQSIYHYFGIDHNAVDALHTTAVTGSVTAGGRVLDQNGHEVATGAITAGRQDMTGSTRHDANGTTFYTRPPSVSFQSPSLEAFVVMKDGVFQFAIIKSCGNPVMTPQQEATYNGGGTYNPGPPPVVIPGNPTVAVTCNRIDGIIPGGAGHYFRIFLDNANDDGHILGQGGPTGANGYYALDIDGANPAIFGSGGFSRHFVMRAYTNGNYNQLVGGDVPFDASFNCNPTVAVTCNRIDGIIPGGAGHYFRIFLDNADDDGHILGQGGPTGDSGYYALDINGANPAIFGGGGFTRHFVMRAYTNGNYNVLVGHDVPFDGSFNCVGTPPPAPAYSCDKLTSVALSRASYSFTTAASASNGATIAGYSFDFGDGSSPTTDLAAGSSDKGSTVTTDQNTPTVTHTYDTPGTYTVVATVNVNVPGAGVQPVTSPACETTVTVAPAPAAECTKFTLLSGANRVVTASDFQTNVTGGAAFQDAVIDWGDGTTKVTTPTVIGQTHQYAADGNYTATVVANFTADGQPLADAGTACKQPVTFTSTPPVCTPPSTGTPPNCVTPCTPTPPTTGTTPPTGTSPMCATPTGPTTLVNTGPGSLIGMFGAVTAIGTLGYRFLLNRRLTGSL